MAQRLVVHLSVAALLLHLTVHVFQQIVQEGAHLRGLEPGLLPLPGPQAVFHEIAEMAGLHPVDTAGGHGDGAAVQGLHRLRREPSPLHPLGAGHGGKSRRVPGLSLEIPPQGFVLPGGAQGRGRQRHAVGAVLPLYLQPREQQPHPLHHEGGPQLRTGHIGDGPRDMHLLRGLGKAGVDILQFVVQRVKGGVRQGDVPLRQRLPVVAVQHAAVLLDLGQQVVVGSQQKQYPHPVAVVAGDLADLHLIQRGGDGTHAVLGQHQPQQSGELLAVQLRIPQNFHKLIQHVTEDLPQLGVFLRQLHLSCRKQFIRLLPQGVRHTGRRRELIQRPGLVPCGGPLLQAVRQRRQRPAHLFPDAVDLLQPDRALLRHVQSVAVGIQRPRHVPQPHIPPDIPPDHIVFQQVALRRRHAGHAGFQIAEHVLILKAAGHRVHGGQQQRHHRLFQNVAAAADVGRDAVTPEHRLQQRPVAIHAAAGHGNIPIAIALRRQLPDPGGDILHLGIGGGRLIEGHRAGLLLPYRVAAEAVAFQMPQRTVILPGEVGQTALHPRLMGHAHQPLLLGGGILEQLPAPVAQQRHRHAVTPPQRQRQHALLLLVEEGKAIQIQILPVQIMGLGQAVMELLHAGAHIRLPIAQPRVIGGKDQRHIPQLVAHGALHVRHMAVQRLRRDLIGVEFVRQRGQLVQERRPLGGPPEHLQVAVQLL